MRGTKYTISLFLTLGILLACGCERSDIHEIKPIPKTLYQKTSEETVLVQKGDMQPELRIKLQQNSLRYYNYSTDLDDLEFSSINVSPGDYVEAGQILVVFKSEKIESEVEEAQKILEMDKLLLEHTKKKRAIAVDEEKTDDEQNKALADSYDKQITEIEEEINLYTIRLQEKQRELDKCVIRAKEEGMVTFVSESIKNGIVKTNSDMITIASGDVGFYSEIKDDYEFVIGSVYKAVSSKTELDVEVTKIEENETGSVTVYFKPLDEDVKYVGDDRFEIVVMKDKYSDVVYLDETNIFNNGERYFVYVQGEDGFKEPVYVEIETVVNGKAIIKSGLEGGEEVIVK